MDWKTVQLQAKQLERLGRTPKQSSQLVMGQIALNQIMLRRLSSYESTNVRKKIEQLTKKDLIELVERTLNKRNRRVVQLTPVESKR